MTLIFRGKKIGPTELATIQRLIKEHPKANRSSLSRQICERFEWRQPNEKLQDVACREILNRLNHRGLISLPPAQNRSPNQRKKDHKLSVNEELPFLPNGVEGWVNTVAPVSFNRVKGRIESKRWADLMTQHHYLGYQWSVGRSIKYLFHMGRDVIGGMSWGSASWKVRCRDEWIGWDANTRTLNLQHVACNLRFLILPWIRVKNLASHLLSRTVKQVALDWKQVYGVELHLCETFVDPDRFQGTCYKAANWICLGQSQGSSKRGSSYHYHGQIKDVYAYPLRPDFRERLLNK